MSKTDKQGRLVIAINVKHEINLSVFATAIAAHWFYNLPDTHVFKLTKVQAMSILKQRIKERGTYLEDVKSLENLPEWNSFYKNSVRLIRRKFPEFVSNGCKL